MRQSNTRKIALGGMLAAVAVVIMCLGGFVPIATYACPVLCAILQYTVLCFCGRRIAWAWYGVVVMLSLLLGPDKEAAIVFVAVGCYPMLKSVFERCRFGVLLKLVFFNGSVVIAYLIMIHLLGMQEVATENMEFGVIGLAIIVILGNVTFFLLDRLLSIMEYRFH